MKKQLLVSAFAIACIALYAQESADPKALIDADISALNTRFTGIAVFKVDRDQRLIADYFDNGTRYREDVVYMEFLAPEKVVFNTEENTVMCGCAAEHDKCIDKEVMKLGTISKTGRMNLPAPAGDAQGAQAIALLEKLINDDHQQRSLADATKAKKRRKN